MLLSVAGRALARVTARARIYSPGAASVALALGLFGGVGALSVAISEEKVYESNSPCGKAGRQDFWKATHKNANIVSLENDFINLLLTKVRDAEVSGALFRRYADRLMASMIELAMGEIDNDDATVTTPAGVKCGGNSWGKEISGASVQRSGAPGSDCFHNILDRLIEPSSSVSRIVVQTIGNEAKVRFSDLETASPPFEGRAVVLTDPVINTGRSAMAAVEALKASGVDDGDIVIACILISPSALAAFAATYPEITICAASLETEVKNGELLPGIGDFCARYAAI